MSSTIEVLAVPDRASLDAFLSVPWRVFADDTAWTPPLLYERKRHLDPKTNPTRAALDQRLWVAVRDGTPVGRISAQVNPRHLERHGDATGHFGYLDAVDDGSVFAALLNTAEEWLKGRGLERIAGPFNSSINEECGLLVNGFETPPAMMMGHARPYAADRLEALGYGKLKDLLAYRLDTTKPLLTKAQARFVDKLTDTPGVRIRPLDLKRYGDEVRLVVDIFNDAWSENWGFIPFTEAEVEHMAAEMKPLISKRSMAVAEVDGEAVAFALALPNINEAVADLDGKLLPFGWLKLLLRLKGDKIRSARMPLMGLKKTLHGTPLGAALSFAVINQVHAAHQGTAIEMAELSWILEDNKPIQSVLEQVGAEPYKTYRIYGKDLAESTPAEHDREHDREHGGGPGA